MTKNFTFSALFFLMVGTFLSSSLKSQLHISKRPLKTLTPYQKLQIESFKTSKPKSGIKNNIQTLSEGDCMFVEPAFNNLNLLYTDADQDGQEDGYVVGTNPYDDQQKAEFYDFSSASNNNFINGVVIYFADAKGADPTTIVPIRVYDGSTNTVGAEIGHTDITFKEIMDSVARDTYVFVEFNGLALPASKKVFVSVDMTNLDYYDNDLLGIYSSDFDELPVNTGWEQWSDDNGDPAGWYEFSDPDNYGSTVSLAFAPLIGTSAGCIQIITPVKLSNFVASKFGSANKLEWTTETESGNKGFEIQRSENGSNFTTIGFVASKAKSGNSVSAINYTFIDNAAPSGSNYYRVKQVDQNLKATFTKTLLLTNDKLRNGGILVYYPNPVKNSLNVILDLADNKSGILSISDLAGRALITKNVQGINGNQNISFNTTSLAKGTYFLKLSGDGNKKLVKFVKN